MEKRVRVQNLTSDGTSIRVFIIHLHPGIRAIFDVQQGQYTQNNHMTPGDRGVIVYDDFQEKVIATGSFVLGAQNVRVIVAGDAIAGYTLSYEVQAD
jgi:hypothetical protein